MPLYSLQCPDCLEVAEHFMGMDDNSLLVKCPECGRGLTRELNRHYMSDLPSIQGDTVAGGYSWNYYDENLGCHIKSKRHRDEEMKRRDLSEWVPDPIYKKYSEESSYIKRNSAPGDADAAVALRESKQTAGTERRHAAIDEHFKTVDLPELPDI